MKKIFTFIFACIAAMTATAQNDGSTVSWGLNGTGTEADPYIISTAADFAAMANNCNADHKGTGEYFKMTNDIDFCGSATAGSPSTIFVRSRNCLPSARTATPRLQR